MSKRNKKNRTPQGFKWVDNGNEGERLEDRRSKREKATDSARLNRAASRQAALDAGTLQRSSGSGAHGGTVEQNRRRDRRSWKDKLRHGGNDE